MKHNAQLSIFMEVCEYWCTTFACNTDDFVILCRIRSKPVLEILLARRHITHRRNMAVFNNLVINTGLYICIT